MKVALFATCIGDTMFPNAVAATAKVLTRLGCDVVFPKQQTCCGQMHVNTGYQQQILPQLDTYAEAFSDPSIDYIVAPSGSCAGAVRHQHPLVAARYGTSSQEHQARACAAKTLDLSEFIIDIAGVSDVGAYFPHSVTYHSTCHSLRVLKVGERPLKLLRAVEGIDLRPLPDATQCCGFGGTFSVKNAETSAAMVADKISNIGDTGAEFVTAGDASCLLNIEGALRRNAAPVQVLHLAEILAATKNSPFVPDSRTPAAKARGAQAHGARAHGAHGHIAEVKH